MKVLRPIGVLVLGLSLSPISRGQSPITSMSLGPDSIGKVRTALGITTRISFPEPVLEIVCGDLYDPGSGKGTFVAQPSGTKEDPGNDVFVKPVAAKGLSNMFVTTGKGKKHTYNFDLEVVPVAQAHRIVTVVDARPLATPPDSNSGSGGSPANGEDSAAVLERIKAEAEQQTRQKAADILRGAQQQADRKITEAETRAGDLDRETAARAGKLIEKRFIQALMLGLRDVRINKPTLTQKKLIAKLDPPSVLLFDEKAYLRYTLQNTGESEFVFGSITLEMGAVKEAQPIPIELNPSKAENKLAAGEVLTGVIIFDPKPVGKDRLTFVLRGEDQTEIGRIVIQ